MARPACKLLLVCKSCIKSSVQIVRCHVIYFYKNITIGNGWHIICWDLSGATKMFFILKTFLWYCALEFETIFTKKLQGCWFQIQFWSRKTGIVFSCKFIPIIFFLNTVKICKSNIMNILFIKQPTVVIVTLEPEH